jgi:hypothetical protein
MQALPGNNTAQAIVTVRAAPRLTAALSGGLLLLNVTSAEPGSNYIIQASTSLNSWVPIKTNAAAADGTFSYTDPNTHSFGARYYRVQRR